MNADISLLPALALDPKEVDAQAERVAQEAAAHARHELSLVVREMRRKGHTWGKIARALKKRGLTIGNANWNASSLWAIDLRSVNYVGSHGVD